MLIDVAGKLFERILSQVATSDQIRVQRNVFDGRCHDVPGGRDQKGSGLGRRAVDGIPGYRQCVQ